MKDRVSKLYSLLDKARFYDPDYLDDITEDALLFIYAVQTPHIVLLDKGKSLQIMDIKYRYCTNRGDKKEGNKLIFMKLGSDAEKKFFKWVKFYNRKNPNNKISDVVPISMRYFANAYMNGRVGPRRNVNKVYMSF